ncbi:uncharacterized protein F4822DRAFT_425076 [Hypoxylon trugodes]|uniref:uncharacterized protein n=1 Tax=Hypoxylon trugodes TaxID=326681 RepID=UPI002198EAC3|nr:uncharacterized protein F4822DRAFT_425076 [Hypoxylon trugodes]KAI1391854.1 hypothetical protein F4822DRAFT_425076 [Hypoxylon trugodes]
MEGEKVLVGEKPTKLTFAANPEKDDKWKEIIADIKPFIRCNTGHYHYTTDPRTARRVKYTTLQAELAKDAQLSAVGPAHRRQKGSSGPSLLDMPVEIFEKILLMSMDPHDLKASIYTKEEGPKFSNPLLMVFAYPRAWKAINLFSVCKAFRTIAIQNYGQPLRHSLPFNPKMDRLVIGNLLSINEIQNLLYDNGCSMWMRWNFIRSKIDEPWLVRDGAYCYNMAQQKGDVIVSRQPIPGFFDRIKEVSITSLLMGTDSGAKLDDKAWVNIFYGLNKTLPKLKTLSLSVYDYDDCGAFPPDFNVYKALDAWMIEGLSRVSTSEDKQLLPTRLFPQMEHFEIVKKRKKCTGSVRGFYGLSFGNWLFSGGESDWDIEESYGWR